MAEEAQDISEAFVLIAAIHAYLADLEKVP